MNHSGFSLGDFFRAARDRGEPLVLATVARTLGSTYRKAGAQMLIAGDGRAAGLLSGGCLETDLMERARSVLAGAPVVADYDTRSSDDLIWGIGLGCEGAMTILLTRLDRANVRRRERAVGRAGVESGENAGRRRLRAGVHPPLQSREHRAVATDDSGEEPHPAGAGGDEMLVAGQVAPRAAAAEAGDVAEHQMRMAPKKIDNPPIARWSASVYTR